MVVSQKLFVLLFSFVFLLFTNKLVVDFDDSFFSLFLMVRYGMRFSL